MISRLRQLLDSTTISLADIQQQQLIDYIELLAKWNHVYNLTAVRDKQQMLVRHILDSLVAAPHIAGENLIDVGTGAGLPGIPLAITYTDRHFTLLDSLGKRMRFLQHVIHALGLKNIKLAHHRVEDYFPPSLFDGVISRAYSSLDLMARSCQHLLAADGRFYALKGCYPRQEIGELPPHIRVVETVRLHVPSLDEERHLIVMSSIN